RRSAYFHRGAFCRLDYCRIQQSKLPWHVHHNGKRVVPIDNSYAHTATYTTCDTDPDWTSCAWSGGGLWIQRREWDGGERCVGQQKQRNHQRGDVDNLGQVRQCLELQRD